MEKSKDTAEIFCIWKTKNIINTGKFYLDSLRGFTVLGHLIQHNDDGLLNPVFNIIYSFHRPLFFLLVGVLEVFLKIIEALVASALLNV